MTNEKTAYDLAKSNQQIHQICDDILTLINETNNIPGHIYHKLVIKLDDLKNQVEIQDKTNRTLVNDLETKDDDLSKVVTKSIVTILTEIGTNEKNGSAPNEKSKKKITKNDSKENEDSDDIVADALKGDGSEMFVGKTNNSSNPTVNTNDKNNNDDSDDEDSEGGNDIEKDASENDTPNEETPAKTVENEQNEVNNSYPLDDPNETEEERNARLAAEEENFSLNEENEKINDNKI